MIIEAFERALASRWGELLMLEMDEEENKPVTPPVALAFMALEQNSEYTRNGEVAITPGLEKLWRVLEQEYLISRGAAEVLMILAKKYPSVVRIRNDDSNVASMGYKLFEDGLEELTDAGVLGWNGTDGSVMSFARENPRFQSWDERV